MGEAKARGSTADRVAGALTRGAGRQAPVMHCNACQAALPDVSQLDTGALQGIELAFKAHCQACDQDTWAVRGESAAVRAFYAALEKSVGQKVLLGTVKARPQG